MAACAGPADPATTTTTAGESTSTTLVTTPVAPAPPTTTASIDQGDLAGWEVGEIFLGERRLLVAMADEPAERSQGLMGVESLGDLDGMLFTFPGAVDSAFWMKDTLIPLDIAFFATDGRLLEVLTMEPCSTEPCPRYQPQVVYRFALEAPAGMLVDLDPSTSLTFP